MRALAICLFAAAGFGLAVPALAEDDIYVGAGSVGTELGIGPRVRDRDRDDVYRRDNTDRRTNGFDRAEGLERCRTTIIRRDDGSVQKIKRCRD